MAVLKVEQIVFRDRQMLILSVRDINNNQGFGQDTYIDGTGVY